MRLIRLDVESFGPIRQASLEFGPGLNVLYGQNDLGKSYLAHSIRAALLLPHTSTAHQEFVPWDSDETPRVVLVFQTHDEEYWRVSKAFGKTAGAAATLERSPNGEQWSMEAKGRDVDGQLRRLLEWGIPEPGGKGKRLPRGLPSSFLTQVLLAEQGSATDVFDHSLEGDPDESGKQLLGQALQALAQDPLFKSVLERSQQRVDEAYLPTGKLRRGRHDPFPKARVAIRQAQQEHESRKLQLEETTRVQEQLTALSQDRLQAQAAREEAAAALAALEEAWRAQQRQVEIGAQLAEAEAQVAKVDAAETEAAGLAKALEERERQLAEAMESSKQAEQDAESARERQRQAEGEEGAARKELEREQLEKRLLELQASERDARERFEAAEKAGARVKAIADLAAEIEKREGVLAAVKVELGELDEERQALEKNQNQLRGVGALLRWRRAVAELEEATGARDRAVELKKQAGERRAEADALVARLAVRKLPEAPEVQALRALARDLEVAQARLDVGLSVRVALKRAVDLQVSADGEEPETTAGATGEHLFEAERAVRLALGDIADVEIDAGAPEARREAEELAKQWREEAAPVLKAAGVEHVEALEEACRTAGDDRRVVEEGRAEAARLEAEAAELGELAGQVDAREARAKEREVAIAEYDREALEAAAQLGEDAEAALETMMRADEKTLEAVNARREEKRRELDRAETDLGHLKKELLEEERQREELTAQLELPWEEVLAKSEAELKRIAGELEQVAEKRATIEKAQSAELVEVRKAAEDAEKRLEQARAAVASGTEARDQAKVALESKRGQLEVLRENAGQLDLAALRASFSEARAAFEAVGVGSEAITEEGIAAARQALEERQATLAESSREVDKLQGALEQVGGEVAVEREKMALEALLMAKDRERQLEVEYGAWRLLVETLREAENEESTHLGRALIGPVSERFSELTGGRYGRIGLDPDLKTTGIGVGGDEREVGSLSQGLKEQLATIFRISVAQHLESMIVLDDHLTHTDPERLGWFRKVLRGCGEEIQIVVFTCRPGDYLVEGELAKARGSERVGRVNLEKTIENLRVP